MGCPQWKEVRLLQFLHCSLLLEVYRFYAINLNRRFFIKVLFHPNYKDFFFYSLLTLVVQIVLVSFVQFSLELLSTGYIVPIKTVYHTLYDINDWISS